MHFHNSSFPFNFLTSIFLFIVTIVKNKLNTLALRESNCDQYIYNSRCTFDPHLYDVPTVLVLHVLTVFPSFAFVDNAIVSRHYHSQNNDDLDNVCKTMALSRNTMLLKEHIDLQTSLLPGGQYPHVAAWNPNLSKFVPGILLLARRRGCVSEYCCH